MLILEAALVRVTKSSCVIELEQTKYGGSPLYPVAKMDNPKGQISEFTSIRYRSNNSYRQLLFFTVNDR